MSRLEEIIEDLTRRKRAISCDGKNGLLLYMEEIGFTWKAGKTDGHKVFVHEQLTQATEGLFMTHSIDCGHAPRRPMKFQYVVKTISLLKKYSSELNELLRKDQ